MAKACVYLCAISVLIGGFGEFGEFGQTGQLTRGARPMSVFCILA